MMLRTRDRIVRGVGLVTALVAIVAPSASAVNAEHQTIVSADAADWTPHVRDGRVNAIVQIGDKIVAGGTFTEVREANRSTFYPRSQIFAFDATTGQLDPNFAPTLDGPVEALAVAPDGRSVFVGGNFNTVNGATRRKVALLDLATGQLVTGFRANANARVLDLAVTGNRLFMAGAFTTIGGVTRQGLAAVSTASGALDPSVNFTFTDPRINTPRVMKIDITPDGARLIAIGNFRRVSGLDRGQIAMLDLTTSPASVAAWQTNDFPQVDPNNLTSIWCSSSFDSYMRDVDFSPDGSYFVVVTTGAYRANRLCDTASRWETSANGPGGHPTWIDWTGGDTSTAVAITGTAVYVGGHERWWNNPYAGDRAGPGAVSRLGIVALDPVNGLPFSWNPRRDPPGVGVFALLATDAGLWVGSDTDNISGEFHGKIGFMPLDGGTEVPPSEPYALPNDLYNLDAASGAMLRRAFDGAAFGSTGTVTTSVDWRQARGAFVLNDTLYYGWNEGTNLGRLYSRTFDGSTLGPAVQLNLNGLEVQPPSSFLIPGTTTRVPALTTQLANASGMFVDHGRLYYTVRNEPRLYYRYFTPESEVVGANLFVASTTGVDWRNVAGMTLADGQIYFSLTSGGLFRIGFSNGQVVGSPTQIATGAAWSSQGFFVFDQVTDAFPPTTPGKPSGVSTSTSSIDLAWSVSSDNVSTDITYRVYRDGDPTPVGTVTSPSSTTVSFTDVGLAHGSVHTYAVDALDDVGNASPLGPTSDPITVLVPDTTPPTTPGQPTGLADGKTRIELTWTASTDDVSTEIIYRIYRDGDPTPVGEITSSSTTTVSFSDAGLPPGSAHTYTVDAQDGATNTSGMSPSSDPITTLDVLFSDGFDSGDFAAWSTVTSLTIDPSVGDTAPPSARGAVTGLSAFARKNLGATLGSVCMSESVNMSSQGANAVDLFRLRTATGGPIVKVYVGTTGGLFIRSDFASVQRASGVTLPAGWNTIELCGAVGSASVWDLYLNGTRIVNAWVANTGTTPVGRIEIGDTTAKTWTGNFDNVILDTVPD